MTSKTHVACAMRYFDRISEKVKTRIGVREYSLIYIFDYSK